MVKAEKQEVLAEIRTLLALERNYLAEERTALAEFRTGLALTVIGPTASTIIVYILSILPIEETFIFDLLNFTFFSILTAIGIWTSYQSRSKLEKIRIQKRILKDREAAVIGCCKAVSDLLSDLVNVKDI